VPVLFIVYVNYNNVAVSIYADDMNVIVWCDSVQLVINKISSVIKTSETCSEILKIKVNADKCSTTTFLKRLSHLRNELTPLKVFCINIGQRRSNTLLYFQIGNSPTDHI
jgi:hypothetical protein